MHSFSSSHSNGENGGIHTNFIQAVQSILSSLRGPSQNATTTSIKKTTNVNIISKPSPQQSATLNESIPSTNRRNGIESIAPSPPRTPSLDEVAQQQHFTSMRSQLHKLKAFDVNTISDSDAVVVIDDDDDSDGPQPFVGNRTSTNNVSFNATTTTTTIATTTATNDDSLNVSDNRVFADSSKRIAHRRRSSLDDIDLLALQKASSSSILLRRQSQTPPPPAQHRESSFRTIFPKMSLNHNPRRNPHHLHNGVGIVNHPSDEGFETDPGIELSLLRRSHQVTRSVSQRQQFSAAASKHQKRLLSKRSSSTFDFTHPEPAADVGDDKSNGLMNGRVNRSKNSRTLTSSVRVESSTSKIQKNASKVVTFGGETVAKSMAQLHRHSKPLNNYGIGTGAPSRKQHKNDANRSKPRISSIFPNVEEEKTQSKLRRQSTALAASLKPKTKTTKTARGSIRSKKEGLNQIAVDKSGNAKSESMKPSSSRPTPSFAAEVKDSSTLSTTTRGETNDQTNDASAWSSTKLQERQQKESKNEPRKQKKLKNPKSPSWSDVSKSEPKKSQHPKSSSHSRKRSSSSSCSCCRILRSPLFYIAFFIIVGALTSIFVLSSLRKADSLPNSTRPDLKLEVEAITFARAQNDVRSTLEAIEQFPSPIKTVSVHDEAQVSLTNVSVPLRIAQVDLVTASPATIEQVQTLLLNSGNAFGNSPVLIQHRIDVVYIFAQDAMLSICSNDAQLRIGREQLLFSIPCDYVLPSKTGCPNSDLVGLECNICLNGFRMSVCTSS